MSVTPEGEAVYARRILVHYFREAIGDRFDSDCEGEVNAAIDDLLEARMNRATGTVQPTAVVYVCEGWWHPNVRDGQVHDHPAQPGRSWSSVSHRQCEPVYTKRDAPTVRIPEPTPPTEGA